MTAAAGWRPRTVRESARRRRYPRVQRLLSRHIIACDVCGLQTETDAEGTQPLRRYPASLALATAR
jgi:hypothetical protein